MSAANRGKNHCLVATLADTGAVLLPYSYAGATLAPTPSGPVFTLKTYTADDTKQDPKTSITRLNDELNSIHGTWKQTRIVILGHSYGGTIAEEWWECMKVHCPKGLSLKLDPQGDHLGVQHVFSLDSPINGVQYCVGARLPAGVSVAAEFCRLWTNRDQHDVEILNWDRDNSFTAVGTPDDPTYGPLPFGGGGGLRDQVVYKCPGDGNGCIAEPPSFVSHARDCNGQTGNIDGTIHHDIVKACPDVVQFIRRNVLEARDNGPQVGGNPAAGLPPPGGTRPSGAISCKCPIMAA